ncbi:MAG TPA: flagellar biosynthesis protein FliQ [Caldithrix abyssi]|uniref:Flagellar biosynthetic protein FliQ n=1 Tax=Caldithrix abyssi TaxID=187145 RepID=A0A7V1LNY1_CALAY|nr:flagellar biosynthesis protein FliQ [Caldithrix abyssi]
MTTDFVLYIAREAITTVILILLPILGTGLILGLLVGIFQATTQINEMTLTFVPKIIAVFTVIFLLMPWFLELLMGFTREIFNQIIMVTQ